MDIKHKKVTVRELVKGYEDRGEEGVVGYGGNLDIRPPYQREFIYEGKPQEAVIETVRKGRPLSVIYWVDLGENEDGQTQYEILDGQQRTISICQFVNGEFAVKNENGNAQYLHNLTEDQKEALMDYELMVYECDGTDSDKLDWFRTINTVGEKLNNQELLNAVYHGPWLTDAKKRFSKKGCNAHSLAEDYMKGSTIRQDYLETALNWIAQSEGMDSAEEYMAIHQNDPNAEKLWRYFRSVIEWVKATFLEYRKEMKGINWGSLYDQFKDETHDTKKLEKRVTELLMDDDVTKPAGVYPYVLDGDERHLNIRAFTTAQRRQVLENQGRKCASGIRCVDPENPDGEKIYRLDQVQADHITPWSKGGKTVIENCQVLCAACNRNKSSK